MIVFDCSTCGKHYQFSDRFAGRELICTACKTHLVVPEPQQEKSADDNDESEHLSSDFSFPVPPPLPEPTESNSSENRWIPPPPPPPGQSFTTTTFSSDFVGDSEPSRQQHPLALDETSEILAHVYKERHQDSIESEFGQQDSSATISSNESTVHEAGKTREKKMDIRFWFGILSVLILILGIGVYFAVYSETEKPESKTEIVRELEQQATESLQSAQQKDSEVTASRLQSLDDWNKSCEIQDVLILTRNELDRLNDDLAELKKTFNQNSLSDTQKTEWTEKEKKISESVSAAEKRLSRLRSESEEYLRKAIKNEAATALASQDAAYFQAASEFYATEAKRIETENLQTKILEKHEFPTERKRLLSENSFPLNTDWTEYRFDSFDFINTDSEQTFFLFEGNRRLFGDKSLRFCSFKKLPAKFVFPKTRSANCSLLEARYLVFAIRFPELQSLLINDNSQDSGKLAEIKIRFVNSFGYIEYKTVSSDYLETVFYNARGKFSLLEFSLEGDQYWIRSDHFDKSESKENSIDDLFLQAEESKTEKMSENENQKSPDDSNETFFFKRIDWVEIQIVPLSNRTVCWIDGIALSSKQDYEPFDMERLQAAQRESKKKEQNFFLQHREELRKPIRDWIASLTTNSSAETIEKSSDDLPDQPIIASKTDEAVPELENVQTVAKKESEFAGAEEARKRKLFRLVLQEAKGRIQAKQRDRIQTFGPKSIIPDDLDDIQIEEIDLSAFRRLDTELLDLIGEQTQLRHLNLSRTGLNDRNVIKLASLVSLEKLDLSGNQLTFEAFNSIRALKKLRELNAAGIQSNVEGLDALGGLTELEKLNLSRSGIDGIDLNYLLPLADLQDLDISSTKIGDQGSRTIRTFTKLRTLNLSKTRISNAALQSLKNLQHLKRLTLDGTNIDNSCLALFQTITSLEYVSVLSTKITRDAVRTELGADWESRFRFQGSR